MIKLNDYCIIADFDMSVRLAGHGFSVGSDRCIVRYDSDFVYDGDPHHAESHKKGDVRIYNLYMKNGPDEPGAFECPDINTIISWLLLTYGIYADAVPVIAENGTFGWVDSIHCISDNERAIHTFQGTVHNTRFDALATAVNRCLDRLDNNIKSHT